MLQGASSPSSQAQESHQESFQSARPSNSPSPTNPYINRTITTLPGEDSQPQIQSNSQPSHSPNPYINRDVTTLPGQESPSQNQEKKENAPVRNIFAPPPQMPESAPSNQPANAKAQGNAGTSFAGVEQSLPPDMTLDDNFAPPDPTPQDAAPSQSFSYGGAVPPQQTAVNAASSDIREMALKELSMKDPLLASSLYQTGAWVRKGDKVTATVQSGYLKMQLNAHIQRISDFLSELYGERVSFEVNFREVHSEKISENAPAQIQLLCTAFKGQVVGHSKKTDQEMAEDEKNQTSELASSEESENSEDSGDAEDLD